MSSDFIVELESRWLPHITDAGLRRLIELLEKGSPLLIHGCFSRSVPMGCLATHVAWHHPETAHLTVEAGIHWLHHVAGLNPATSRVIREWDSRGSQDWQIRSELLEVLKEAAKVREAKTPTPDRVPLEV